MDSPNSNTWRDILNHYIIARRENGNETLQALVERQNMKVACLEIFNEKNLDYDNIVTPNIDLKKGKM